MKYRNRTALSLVVGCGLAVGACSSPATTEVEDPGAGGNSGRVAADLKIVVTDEDGEEHEYDVSCSDSESAASDAACADLTNYAVGIFDGVADDEMCAQIMEGAEIALVTGTIDGKEVNSEFNRRNSCEASRWQFITDMTDFDPAA